MAYEELLKSISLDADASIGIYTGVPGTYGSLSPNSGKQYRFVKVTGKNTAGLAVAAGAGVIGVLQNKPQMVGDASTIGIFGVTNVEAGATVNPGDFVMPDANGRGITGNVNGSDGSGVCLTGGAVGQLISVLLK